MASLLDITIRTSSKFQVLKSSDGGCGSFLKAVSIYHRWIRRRYEITDKFSECSKCVRLSGPGQYPHLAPTYAAVLSLCLIESQEAYDAIDKNGIISFLWSVRESNGAFRMHLDGEIDVRGAYCAVTVARLCGVKPDDPVFEGTADWIASCQTYEGGFGGAPNLEVRTGEF